VYADGLPAISKTTASGQPWADHSRRQADEWTRRGRHGCDPFIIDVAAKKLDGGQRRVRSDGPSGWRWYGMLTVVGRSSLTGSSVVVLLHRLTAGSDEF